MTNFKTQEQRAYDLGLTIHKFAFHDNLRALLVDNQIFIDPRLPISEAAVVLAEEIAHHQTGYCDARLVGDLERTKQELAAAKAQQHELLPPDKLLLLLKKTPYYYEIAEETGLPEKFIRETMASYACKYPDKFKSSH